MKSKINYCQYICPIKKQEKSKQTNKITSIMLMNLYIIDGGFWWGIPRVNIIQLNLFFNSLILIQLFPTSFLVGSKKLIYLEYF